MRNVKRHRAKTLGRAEQAVMDCIWARGPIAAEDCRAALAASWPMKDSTVRTVLRRLEAKGYVAHEIAGRTFIYRAAESPVAVAARAVAQVIDRFCGGSAEQLVAGLVDHEVLTPAQLERLAKTIAERKPRKP